MKAHSTCIDSIQLYDQFLIKMTQLKKFTFSINTEVFNHIVIIELPSNEDIKRSFINKGYEQVASYIHINSMHTQGKCHIYSLPYDFEYLIDLDNCFQGGMFDKVRYLTINDMIPYQQEVFKLISQNFPFLEFLSISNRHRLEGNQYSSTLITFSLCRTTSLKKNYSSTSFAKSSHAI